ncbi:MAG: patatin-like phospholipase family protein [Chitinophagales bacterium]
MSFKFKDIYQKVSDTLYFFPFNLILNHIKENFVLGFSWLIILLMVTNNFGIDYGVPILFLNPEYFGIVGYFSFHIVGMCLGIFYITWNLISYLMYSYRYPFMASLKWPFAMFTFNNSIIPLAFFIVYVYKIIQFQQVEMDKDNIQIAWMILGIASGFALILFTTSFYFLLTNKNIFKFINQEDHDFNNEETSWVDLNNFGKAEKVEYYLSRKFRIRPVREVKHYSERLLRKVFQQHHINAFLIIFLNTLLLVALGFVVDNPIFEIPAAGTIFLFFSILISLSGLIYHWAGKWGTVMLIAVLLTLNYFSKTKWMQRDSQAYGLDYTYKQEYSLEELRKIANEDSIELDISNTLKILEKWKEKNTEGKPYRYKPKMVIVLSSGGGNRAAAYTVKVLQTLDSLSNGDFLNHTMLMTGASGGMMGITYYRELYLRKKLNILDNIYSEKYVQNVSGDLINKITSTIVTNDMFFGFKKYKLNNKKYTFDRGTAFELAFNNYTEDLLKKPIVEYENFEKNATIPMLLLNTISITDLRKLVISPHNVRYLMHANTDIHGNKDNLNIDAIDFKSFFSKNNPDSLNVISAVRMNATYPLILPNVSLPSEPKIDVFDAGIRDNFGIEDAVRFINVFQNWIKKNTSGVMIVQIRDNVKNKKIEDFEYQTFVSKLGSSFGSIYSNITNSQDYLHNYMLEGTNEILDGKLSLYNLEYSVGDNKKRASMSLRLSQKELENVIDAAVDSTNMQRFNKIIEEIEE